MMRKELVKHINSLCGILPYEYLKKSSNWFSENLVDINHTNCYPYYHGRYNEFFFDNNISRFQKDVGLKFVIHMDMHDTSKDILIISKWIVKVWGGIKGIKDSTMKNLVNGLDDTEYPFENISSWSKIHSFKNIDSDIIYDSKVVYAINWLILKSNINEQRFFHQPLSRNNRLKTFPIDTIINYRFSDKIDMNQRGEKITNEVYHSKSDVYTKYRELIHNINSEIWVDEVLDLSTLIGKKICLKDYPFFTEMLLFNMSDDVIFKDIRKKVNIIIK